MEPTVGSPKNRAQHECLDRCWVSPLSPFRLLIRQYRLEQFYRRYGEANSYIRNHKNTIEYIRLRHHDTLNIVMCEANTFNTFHTCSKGPKKGHGRRFWLQTSAAYAVGFWCSRQALRGSGCITRPIWGQIGFLPTSTHFFLNGVWIILDLCLECFAGPIWTHFFSAHSIQGLESNDAALEPFPNSRWPRGFVGSASHPYLYLSTLLLRRSLPLISCLFS